MSISIASVSINRGYRFKIVGRRTRGEERRFLFFLLQVMMIWNALLEKMDIFKGKLNMYLRKAYGIMWQIRWFLKETTWTQWAEQPGAFLGCYRLLLLIDMIDSEEGVPILNTVVLLLTIWIQAANINNNKAGLGHGSSKLQTWRDV